METKGYMNILKSMDWLFVQDNRIKSQNLYQIIKISEIFFCFYPLCRGFLAVCKLPAGRQDYIKVNINPEKIRLTCFCFKSFFRDNWPYLCF